MVACTRNVLYIKAMCLIVLSKTTVGLHFIFAVDAISSECIGHYEAGDANFSGTYEREGENIYNNFTVINDHQYRLVRQL